ncbi:hypothetical protein BJX63DRAFT_436242 [Aspergillus granulosus]|uniref:Uncharacterized protein n=1 Tax=Aspergillus granulosus TaxID=176169 RepID=A0ABR4H0C1_9EURO
MSSSSTTPKLSVRLHSPSIPASFDPPIPVSVRISVTNTAESPVTLLNWGSPLDPRANILGVFVICDADSGESIALDEIKFRRVLPAPPENFVQIPASDSVGVTVVIPRAPLAQGRRYTLQAKGWWQAVWEASLEDVPKDDLEQLTGALRGEFVSNVVPIETE